MADAGNSRDYRILRGITGRLYKADKGKWKTIEIPFPHELPDDDYYQLELKKLFRDYYKHFNHRHFKKCENTLLRINHIRSKYWYNKPITNVKWE